MHGQQNIKTKAIMFALLFCDFATNQNDLATLILGILVADGFKFLEQFGTSKIRQHVYTKPGVSLKPM